METITVQAVTKEPKQARGRTYWGVKVGDKWFNLFTDQKPQAGAIFHVNVKESQYQGKTYRWAEIDQKAQQKAASNGKITAEAYIEAMRWFHDVAKDLEPDDAQARCALVDTALIAFSSGKIDMEEPFDDDVPPPADDDIPF